ncbi:MAG: aspartate aminotransferase family protein, partial [Lentisphaeraceae bacterium]|nr:aspartate aminotransferase family protein [Lentisphaeraceae bacterium]
DPLNLAGLAKWTHVDAAGAGPLALSPTHAPLLKGIENADSLAISAHKYLFQPKDSAVVMFRQTELANPAISFGGAYLATPNIGIQGSRGAAAIPLLATMIAWGNEGLGERLARTMATANKHADTLENEEKIILWGRPKTGVTLFRPLTCSTENFIARLPDGMFSTCHLEGKTWIRSVAANPVADIDEIISTIRRVIND